jgi:hypothetical protein
MLSKVVFGKLVEKLVIEYGSKGFDMPKTKANQWYERFSSFSDDTFAEAIATVLDTCYHSPSMADVVKAIEPPSQYRME